MYFIAHRGNTNGPQPTFEKKINYLQHAYYELGHGVECDVYTHKDKLYLGHDEPDTPVTTKIAEFIKQPKVFVHAKDIESIPALLTMGCNVFFHKADDVVFTSRGHITEQFYQTMQELLGGELLEKKLNTILPIGLERLGLRKNG